MEVIAGCCRESCDIREEGHIVKRGKTLIAALTITLGGLTPAVAHPGIGIVMDSRGNVYYTDLAQVWRIGADGKKAIAVKQVHTHELYLDPQGNLFGEHLWYEGDATKKWGYRVWRLGADSTRADVVPAREGFRTDYSFVRDGGGTMYWAERDGITRIKRRAAEGRSVTY